MITELSDSVKREAFEEAVRGLQLEIEAKTAELKVVEGQAQEARLRTNASLSMLEEELIRHKQTIQKLTFELDSQKRRAQTASEDVERYRRREKELTFSLESEGKASYQGLSYSPHALVKQL
jgi:chromosome segregation ATPase